MILTPARSGRARSAATRSGYPVALGKVLPRYALSNVARSGATRSNYHSPSVFIAIGGVHYGTGRAGAAGVLNRSLTIRDELNETPNTAICTTVGFIPVEGQDVVITLGSRNNFKREFAGTILSTREFYVETPRNYQHSLNLIDYTWGMNKRKVRARYTATTVAVIAAGLLTYTAGYTLTIDADIGAAAIDEITFTEVDVAACFSQLVTRVGGAWYCDYHKVVRVFFVDTADTPPTLINAVHRSLMAFDMTRDLSQVTTRLYVEGGGSTAVTDVAKGETILPVAAGEWYEAGGGVVVSGPQRITYAACTLGGGGALVGPGAGPSTAPKVELAVGTGMDSGVHRYAVTFATAAGESLPSPLATISVGLLAPPPTPVVPGSPKVGTGPEQGSHSYGFTFVTATGGETTISPLATITTTVLPAPTQAPTPSAPYPGAGVDPGVHDYAVTFLTAAGGETTPGPIGGSVTTYPLAGPVYRPSVWAQPTGEGHGLAGWHIGDTIEVVYTYSSSETDLFRVSAPSPPTQQLLLEDAQFPGFLMTIFAQVNLPTDPRVAHVEIWVRNVTTGSAFLSKIGFVPPNALGGPYTINIMTSGWAGVLPAPNDIIGAVPVTVPRGLKNLGNGLFGADPLITSRKLYRRSAGAGLRLAATIPNNTDNTYTDTTPNASLGAAPPATNLAALQQILVTAINTGPALVTGRKLYRSVAGSSAPLRLVTTIADNATTTFLDTVPDASLGATAPTTNTAPLNQVAVSSIPTGVAAVLNRRLYRTVAGGTQLKRLTQINDNVWTTFLDSASDAGLGVNAPVTDTSGLAQAASTQVLAGSTSVIVADSGAFAPTGGWAVIGNGEQVIRYTGLTANALTGIPTSGPGAIVASITWNTTITAAPALTGIAASGAGSIQVALVQGDDVNLWVQLDDVPQQAALAAVLGGDGIQEDWLQDRRLSHREAVARGQAQLATKRQLVIELRYQTRDINTRTGRLCTVNLGAPFNIIGTFLIRAVTERPFAPHVMPLFEATASNARFTFDDFLRLIHDEVT